MPPKPSNGSNPLTDPHTVPALYADRVRVQRRSNALLTAKIRGAHVGNTVADLLTRQSPHLTDHPAPLIADLAAQNPVDSKRLLNELWSCSLP